MSRHLVYNAIREYGIPHERFTRHSQEEIENAVSLAKQNHPNAGEAMMQGPLAVTGVHVPRHKVRAAIHSIDPGGGGGGLQARKTKPIKRRVYSVPFPNYVWHIDGNHKLLC